KNLMSEITFERKGLTKSPVPRRLYHEIGTLGFAREQMEQLKKEVWKDKGSREIEIGMAPYFREKIRNMAMKENDEVVFTCYADSSDGTEGRSMRDEDQSTRAYDIGVYKCVARNMHGVSCCRARLKLGSKPGRPEKPVARDSSDTEIYITWAVPRDEGNCTTLGYALEFKKADNCVSSYRGRFSVVLNVWVKETNTSSIRERGSKKQMALMVVRNTGLEIPFSMGKVVQLLSAIPPGQNCFGHGKTVWGGRHVPFLGLGAFENEER
ncbi:obscurin, partial [Trichonephila inaurata madagascariensis]